MGRTTIGVVAGVLILGGIGYFMLGTNSGGATSTNNRRVTPGSQQALADKNKAIGKALYSPGARKLPTPPAAPIHSVADPIVMGDCRLVVFEKEDVPAQREGQILFIGTEIEPGQQVEPDRLIEITDESGKKQRYRKLHEGDFVKKGQLLARLDDKLYRQEWAIKKGKVEVARADHAASEASRDEAKKRWENGQKLHAEKRAIGQEELDERKLVWVKYKQEAISKQKGIELAELEAKQAQIVVDLHEIRSSIDGIIKSINKNPGESVKGSPSPEAVFQILNLGKLRVEGLAEEQNLYRLKVGDTVSIEAAGSQGPDQLLNGHLQEITGVAVSRDGKYIVSSSQDATVRVWERSTRSERRILHHTVAVTSVTCTPYGAPDNLCVSGCLDGSLRIYDLSKDSKDPIRTIPSAHRGPINCLTFSPDGATFASGGDDRDIAIWDTAKGELKYRVQQAHNGAVTAISYTPNAQLVSAGRDNNIRIWSLGEEAARLENSIGKRSGDVPQLGVSPDGKQMLFDPWQSKSVRLLSLPDGLNEGVLEESSGAARLTTFALFAPDGKAILTAGGTDGRMQLWQPPSADVRPHVRRYLVSSMRPTPNCAAFSPDGSFIVVGTKERHILVWPRHWKHEMPENLSAKITFIDRSLDSHQTRIWAVIDNPNGVLSPGATVTMVKYPK